MRNLRVAFAVLSLATFPVLASAQHIGVQVQVGTPPPAYYYPPPVAATAPPVVAAPAVVLLAPEQLDQLTGAIALYPDPLLAQVLAASTAPLDVAAANQWLRGYPPNYPPLTDDQINAQPWAPAVKALAHYPTVLQFLADRIAWTQQLGSAFVYQPADVMASVQRLRVAAQYAGTLYPTPQQQVFVDGGAIRILPPTPQLIYVPVYDPAVVYVRGGIAAPITFAASFSIGGWLDLDFDWGGRVLYGGAHWNDPHVVHDHVFYRPGPPPPRWVPDPHRGYPAPHADPGHGWDGDHRGFYPDAHRDPVRDERRGHDSMHGGGGPGPDHGAPSHGAPDHGAPDHGSPAHGAPDHGAPDHGAPDHHP